MSEPYVPELSFECHECGHDINEHHGKMSFCRGGEKYDPCNCKLNWSEANAAWSRLWTCQVIFNALK